MFRPPLRLLTTSARLSTSSLPAPTARPTPTEFRSLYRLLLRSAAGAVLYSRPATKHLRKLYRAEFERWAKAESADWAGFHEHLDRTLLLLSSSSLSTALPHKLTRNLSNLHHTMLTLHPTKLKRPARWNPQNPPPPPGSDEDRRLYGRARQKAWVEGRWEREGLGALGEMVGMAEGSAGVWLGRLEGGRRLPG